MQPQQDYSQMRWQIEGYEDESEDETQDGG
jgi:hypothetical protein